jgi:mono/diheme cytochrome c family protein
MVWSIAAVMMSAWLAAVVACQKKTDTMVGQNDTTAVDSTQLVRLQPAQESYLANCAMCHGASGAGDGPLEPELRSQGITKPAVLNDRARLAQLGKDEIVRVIEQGGGHTGRSNLMPPWVEKIDAQMIDQIADYVMLLPDVQPGTPAATVEKFLSAPPGSSNEGRKLYVFYCTSCHGPYGLGDGAMADSLWARNGIRPRNLTDSVYFARKSDQELFSVVELGGGHHGKSPFMPGWSYTLPPDQIRNLVSYIRTLSRTPAQ